MIFAPAPVLDLALATIVTAGGNLLGSYPMTAQPPAPSAILETALYSGDLARAERFWGGLIGLEMVLRQAGRHVFFRCGDGMLLIFDPSVSEVSASPQGPGHLAHGARGPGHMCFAATDAEITAWRARFEAEGIAIEDDFHWPNGARSLYIRDPDGNSIEFAEPRLWAR